MSIPSARGSISRSTARSCSNLEREIADFLGDLWLFCQSGFQIGAATWHGFCIYWKYIEPRPHNARSAIHRDGIARPRSRQLTRKNPMTLCLSSGLRLGAACLIAAAWQLGTGPAAAQQPPPPAAPAPAEAPASSAMTVPSIPGHLLSNPNPLSS